MITGCSTISSPNISEISFRNGGGQLVYWFQIVLRSDGTADYVGDVSPDLRNSSRPFGHTTREVERVKYHGTISPEQFEQLTKIIMQNNFFSLRDNYGDVSGAPMTTTGVVYSGKRKEVNNQLAQAGEGLSEIERAINKMTDQIKWVKGF